MTWNPTLITMLISLATKAGIVITIMIGLYIADHFLKKAITLICKRKNVSHHTSIIIKKAAKYLLFTFGSIIALENIGIKVTPLITAFGISGIALSFGLKDIISNIVAGLMIMIYRPFKIGDSIKTKDGQGIVTDINIRYTTLKNDDAIVMVPNAVLYANTLSIFEKK